MRKLAQRANHRQCVSEIVVSLDRSYPEFLKLIGTSQVLYKVTGGEGRENDKSRLKYSCVAV